jgi:hypothetical protein
MAMSYFDAELGKRPTGQSERKESQVESRAEPAAYFATRLGSAPRRFDSRILPADASEHTGAPSLICPLCRGTLEETEGVYRCAGRCGARWLEESAGRLVDVAALPLGICRCCHPPAPLTHGAPGEVICPRSGRAHLLLPGGTNTLLDTLLYGLCPCCKPPMPLVADGDALACLAHPERRYRREGERLVLLISSPGAAETLEAIDTALRHNSARLTINGLFDLD